jgi:hypothetical protein
MQGQIAVFALSLALLSGCAESRSSSTTSPASSDRDAAVSGESCDSIQAEADDLLRDAQTCQQDDDCAFMGIDAPCLLAFLCPSAVSRTADLDQLQDEARRLSEDWRACSDSCAIANCVGFAGVMCNPSTHRCEGRLARL